MAMTLIGVTSTPFYKFDSEQSIRMAPSQPAKHISLPAFTAMRVKFGTQVLSHSVSAGINAVVSFDKLSEEARETPGFLERMDQLFNAFNSYSRTSNQKCSTLCHQYLDTINFSRLPVSGCPL
ncbi:transposable element p transposase [Plakobranchus ocellatus]|uniref:Transposable element p transposase n=1 Tax=Plakobranchus ocellatus TaxID=259542 RepID=A0AAV4D6Z3_9GAST|nr:transposable element p transposase [Plakobranchus ocellatus]